LLKAKKQITVKKIYTIFSFVLMSSLFLSYAGGVDGNYAGAPSDGISCATCHGGGSGGSIALSGAPASYVPGQMYPLTLTINQAQAAVGGFQIVATNGTTSSMVGTFSAPAGTRINSTSRLTHNAPKTLSGGSTAWTFNWTAPASGSPANVVFYYVGNASIRSLGVYSILTGNTRIALPVEMLSFGAKFVNSSAVNLAWSTASERNNSSFAVERSLDNRQFETIGQVKGQGTTTTAHTYRFTDNLAQSTNAIVYYRLRQTDFDGTVTFSKTISVALNVATKLKVYPSLASKADVIHFEIGDNARLEVFDMNGRLIKTVQNVNASETVDMPAADLATGRYIVRHSTASIVQTSGFVVY
jgi:Reeler domain